MVMVERKGKRRNSKKDKVGKRKRRFNNTIMIKRERKEEHKGKKNTKNKCLEGRCKSNRKIVRRVK